MRKFICYLYRRTRRLFVCLFACLFVCVFIVLFVCPSVSLFSPQPSLIKLHGVWGLRTASLRKGCVSRLLLQDIGSWVCCAASRGCIYVLRGNTVNRTYGTYINLYISLFLLTKFGPINCLGMIPRNRCFFLVVCPKGVEHSHAWDDNHKFLSLLSSATITGDHS